MSSTATSASRCTAIPSDWASTTTSAAPWSARPADTPFVALCDQDDYWHPDKLSTLVQALRPAGVTLAYSDQRIVLDDGTVRSQSRGAFAEGWELYGIGTLTKRIVIDLGSGRELELLPRMAQQDYGRLLSECDLGLALMDTPHPSLPPLEMASAGMIVLTTTHANKTAAGLRAISPNIVAVDPTIQSLAAGLLGAAEGRVRDVDARLAGAVLDWPRSWADTFSPEIMERIVALLDATRGPVAWPA